MDGTIAYLRGVYEYRRFCLSLVGHDVKKKYRRSTLGMLWMVVQPLSVATVLAVVFGHATFGSEGGYFLHVLTGLVFWGYVSHVVSAGCGSIRGAENYILHSRVPLAVYPLRTALVGAFHLSVSLVPVVAIAAATGRDFDLTGTTSFLLSCVLLLVFGWAVSTLFGLASLYLPDLQHASGVLLSLSFYATPVIWPPEMAHRQGFGWLVDANPLAMMLALFREPFTGGAASGTDAAVAVATVVLSVAVAAGLLSACERRVALRL